MAGVARTVVAPLTGAEAVFQREWLPMTFCAAHCRSVVLVLLCP